MAVTGGCFCGAVRFSFPQAPITTRVCWCRDCQYLAAGNASVNAIFRAEGVDVAGETHVYESSADSGTRMRRTFCPKCGTPLFSEAASRPHLMVVRVGALDEPDMAQPTAAIWTDSKPAWARLDPDLPTFPGQPPPAG